MSWDSFFKIFTNLSAHLLIKGLNYLIDLIQVAIIILIIIKR